MNVIRIQLKVTTCCNLRYAEEHFWMQNTLKLDADGLEHKTPPGAIHISKGQETEATVDSGSPKLDSRRWEKGCLVRCVSKPFGLWHWGVKQLKTFLFKQGFCWEILLNYCLWNYLFILLWLLNIWLFFLLSFFEWLLRHLMFLFSFFFLCKSC